MDHFISPTGKTWEQLLQGSADKLIRNIALFETAMACGDKHKAKCARAEIESASSEANLLCKEKRRLMVLKKAATS